MTLLLTETSILEIQNYKRTHIDCTCIDRMQSSSMSNQVVQIACHWAVEDPFGEFSEAIGYGL